MDAIETKARELLADVHAQAGWPGCAKEILLGENKFDILHDLAIAAIVAALTLPTGCIPERPVVVAATRIRRLASAAAPMARTAYIKAAEMVEMAVIAGRSEADDSAAVAKVSKAEAEALSRRRVARMEGAE